MLIVNKYVSLLEYGDIIEPNDEILSMDRKTWHKVSSRHIRRIRGPYRAVRRVIKRKVRLG